MTDWNGYKVVPGSVLRYTCDPGHVMYGDHVAWCDGILWNTSAPVCSRPVSEARSRCSFDDVDVDPWCGWSQSDQDDFDWILTDQPTPTLNTGPDQAWVGSKVLEK